MWFASKDCWVNCICSYDPRFGRECPRLPHDISDETSFGCLPLFVLGMLSACAFAGWSRSHEEKVKIYDVLILYNERIIEPSGSSWMGCTNPLTKWRWRRHHCQWHSWHRWGSKLLKECSLLKRANGACTDWNDRSGWVQVEIRARVCAEAVGGLCMIFRCLNFSFFTSI